MEKRFALFLILSALILFTHLTLQSLLNPPKPADQKPAEVAEGGAKAAKPAAEAGKEGAGGTAAKTKQPLSDTAAQEPARDQPTAAAEKPQPSTSKSRAVVPTQWVTLGSMASESPYRLLATLQNSGAGVERIELVQRTATGRFRFQDLEQASGYLGYLALSDEPEGRGCRVNVVGHGTPAAAAKAQLPGAADGLRAGDVIRRIDSTTVRDTIDYERILASTKPGQTVQIAVARASADGPPQEQLLTATLTAPPLSLIHPETLLAMGKSVPSFLLTLESIGDASIPRDEEEIAGLKLRESNWQVRMLDEDSTGPGVEFLFVLTEDDLPALGAEGSLELVKRYRLAKTPPQQLADPSFPSYHLQLELEFRNRSKQGQQLAYRLDGPNGLPLEGWWYLSKIHPGWFKSAGARDVVWNTPSTGPQLFSTSQIYAAAKAAQEKNQPLNIPLWTEPQPQPLEYLGVDTQYFSVVLKPKQNETAPAALFKPGLAIPVGPIDPKDKTSQKTANVSCRLISPAQTVPAGGSWKQEFTVFAGPKQPDLLTAYQLDWCIEYGLFRKIAQSLGWILHLFESLPGVNYGLAIILLTVLVRSCMLPLSRKAAKNAQMMQELAPEMKRIAEKYKDDMQKRAAAQKELFAKHNYNPFGGCLLMFLQLPIFIGLYRALSVDIELRQAPLIPGLHWCSNLAGPDMLWYWKPYLPGFLAGENGWLGPYLNMLPIVTIVLFLVQQKMFMPPATDEQTRMQQQMMKFMMVFMGLLFFRVPSGLCVYFIASSLWSVAERKMLPPVGKPGAAGPKSPSLWERLAAKVKGEEDSDRAKALRRQRKKR